MKTGEDMKQQALCLLNYTDQDGCTDSAMFGNLMKRALAVINQIYGELWYMLAEMTTGQSGEPFTPLAALTEPLVLPPRVTDDVMPYGVAMLMAQTVGDADNQSLFAALYSQKRAAVSNCARRLDVMPKGD